MTRENHLMELLSKAYASLPDSEPLKADIFALAKDLEKNEHDQLARTKLAHAISMYLLTLNSRHHLKLQHSTKKLPTALKNIKVMPLLLLC